MTITPSSTSLPRWQRPQFHASSYLDVARADGRAGRRAQAAYGGIAVMLKRFALTASMLMRHAGRTVCPSRFRGGRF
jgi:hypothetical protein